MKVLFLASMTILLVISPSATSFAPSYPKTTTAHRSVSLNAGIFDFFSADARAAREEKKRLEIEEQERLQEDILERRANPKKMEEYEARVSIRRKAYTEGKDGYAYVNDRMSDKSGNREE